MLCHWSKSIAKKRSCWSWLKGYLEDIVKLPMEIHLKIDEEQILQNNSWPSIDSSLEQALRILWSLFWSCYNSWDLWLVANLGPIEDTLKQESLKTWASWRSLGTYFEEYWMDPLREYYWDIYKHCWKSIEDFWSWSWRHTWRP